MSNSRAEDSTIPLIGTARVDQGYNTFSPRYFYEVERRRGAFTPIIESVAISIVVKTVSSLTPPRTFGNWVFSVKQSVALTLYIKINWRLRRVCK